MRSRTCRVEGILIVQRRAVTAMLAAATLLVTAGCSSGDGEESDGGRSTSPSSSEPGASAPASEQAAEETPPAKGSVKVVRTVTEGLKTPWGLAPLPEGGLLVSSRDEGTITRVDEKTGKKTEVGSVPGVAPAGEGGLMGLALSPSYASDHMVYAYFTSDSDNRIVRMLYDAKKPAGEQLGAPDTVFRGIPKGTNHNGGRIAFGPDKMLYVGTGETYVTELAQDKKSTGGKILRLTPEGEPAPGNPFNSAIYSYGHRNVQGLAWDSKQRLFASEFGQDTWDELNHIKPGDNYGWPDAEGKSDDSKYHNPIDQWSTDEASPSGIAYAEGSIWMAGLRGKRLWRIPLNGTEASADSQAFLEGDYGRLRTVVSAGGNKLWLVTSETDGRGTPESGDDRILELEVT
ncbi:sorbosone dehydrogenase family protein [Streptomyces sp. NBC_00878]|uniref:PQQ-dependent sugar dehydrogenase n=1 Tax=Streptomyces sp. NBC_00878 TaxID=2975854 RepID=UPI00224CBF40|nr:PQQ-dependent sugar dehydrogenase [Streptomyces sp. NBC_00878]MCX4905206.1 PQQ-dependent sugar dehydrogenase [Streptomyces sp. NBC_00878]